MKTLATLLALCLTAPAVAQPLPQTFADRLAELERGTAAITAAQEALKQQMDDVRYKQSVAAQQAKGIEKKIDALADKVDGLMNTALLAAPVPKAEPKKMASTCPGCACGCAVTGECVCAKMAAKAAVPAAPVEGTRYSYDGGQTWTTTPPQSYVAPAYYSPSVSYSDYQSAGSYGVGFGRTNGRLFGGRAAGRCANGSCR